MNILCGMLGTYCGSKVERERVLMWIALCYCRKAMLTMDGILSPSLYALFLVLTMRELEGNISNI